MPKEVARNAPALHAGPHAFFAEKSLAKKLYNLFGLVVLALVTAFGSLFKVSKFDVLVPLRLPGFAAFGCIANCEIPYIKKPSQNANFLLTPSKPQDKLTILYYNKKLDIVEIEGDDYVRNLLF